MDSSFTGKVRDYFSAYGNGSVSFLNIFDPDKTVFSPDGITLIGTGAWRALRPTDFTNIDITGGTFSIGSIAVTGGQINTTVTNTPSVVGSVYTISTGGYLGVTGSVSTVAFYPSSTTVSNSVPSGANGTALAQNASRKSWFVQNNSTGAGPLYVRLGGTASTQNFNLLLKPSSTATAGDGGIFLDDGARWLGSVGVSGQNPNYIIWELT